MEANYTDQDLITKLRKGGLRATSQRLAIMKALMATRSHPSAEELYEQLKPSYPTLSLSTVYKTLQILAEIGEVLTLETGSGKQRFDGYTHNHYHATCVKCEKVFDIDYEKYPINPPEEILPGFKIQSTKVYFMGLCNECQSA